MDCEIDYYMGKPRNYIYSNLLKILQKLYIEHKDRIINELRTKPELQESIVRWAACLVCWIMGHRKYFINTLKAEERQIQSIDEKYKIDLTNIIKDISKELGVEYSPKKLIKLPLEISAKSKKKVRK